MTKRTHTFIIAEAGVNHNGSLEMAKKLIDAAVEAGADAVKFQTFKTEKLVSKTAPKAEYQKQRTGVEETQFDMLKRLELDENAHQTLIEYCRERGILFLSTPFDQDSVDLLTRKLNLPIIKISSGEITNALLLLKVAQTKKNVILSTGMSTLEDIKNALSVLAFGFLEPKESPSIRAFQQAYNSDEGQKILKAKVQLLHCTSEYPAQFSEVNLRAMDLLRDTFDLPVGLSDHTLGISVPIAAVARGASIIEKHFTLDRSLPGPDHQASLEPHELKMMVQSIREVEQALGEYNKIPTVSEMKNRSIVRKSIVAARDIKKGEQFTEDNLDVKRPGTGISPIYYWDLLGKKARKDYSKDDVIEP